MRWIMVAAVLAGCGTNENPEGVFVSTRTVTEADPGASFTIPSDVTLTIADHAATSSLGDAPDENPLIEGGHVELIQYETWDGGGSPYEVNLVYRLDVDGDSIDGTVAATIAHDGPPGYVNRYFYLLAITGQRVTR